ncbi:hypothetical protein PCE1_002671 [Barthelona sp. PCE]
MPQITAFEHEQDKPTYHIEQHQYSGIDSLDFIGGSEHIFYVEYGDNTTVSLKIIRVADNSVVDSLDFHDEFRIDVDEFLIHRENDALVIFVMNGSGYYHVKLDSNFRILSSEYISRSLVYSCLTVDNATLYYLTRSFSESGKLDYKVVATGLRGENPRTIFEQECDLIDDIYAQKEILFILDVDRLIIIDTKNSNSIFIEINHNEAYPVVVDDLYSAEFDCFIMFFKDTEEYKCLVLKRDLNYEIFSTEISSEETDFKMCTSKLLAIDESIYVIENIDFNLKTLQFTNVLLEQSEDAYSAMNAACGNRILSVEYNDDMSVFDGVLSMFFKN